MKDPTRLLEDEKTAQSLRDALRALEQRAPSSDVVCRVEDALRVLPPAPLATGAFGLSAVIGTTTLVALAVTTAVLVQTREPSRPSRTASRVEQVAEPARAPSTVLPAAPEVLPVLAPAAPGRERVNALKPTGQAKQRPARSALPVTNTTARPIASATVDVVERVASTPSDEAASQNDRSAQTQPEPSAAEQAPPPAAVPQDEAGLLYRAKRLSSTHPTAALSLLESHTRYFPDSAFRQEREVLVIKLHHRLGHEELARQLAMQFRARFPSSMYRLSVEP